MVGHISLTTNFFSDTNKRPTINTSDITKCQTIFYSLQRLTVITLRPPPLHRNSMKREIELEKLKSNVQIKTKSEALRLTLAFGKFIQHFST